jgi:branched-chain amino acid transport system ATP-binding protein
MELARALMAEPQCLLLDEPAAGLNDAETADLVDLLAAIREIGVTILIVEHNMSLVMGIADQVIVFDAGRVIADGPPEAVSRDAAVLDAYLGRGPA